MGSSVGFHGDYGEIYHASDSIVDNAEGFLHNLNVLESLMSSLRSNWTGDSATEYNTSYDEVKNVFDRFQRLLDDLGIGVGNAGTIMANNEEDSTAAAGKLRNWS